jgi:hypothetical protein
MIEGKTPLGDSRIKAVGLELTSAERARKKATCVAMRFEIDEEGALERSFGEDHWALR